MHKYLYTQHRNTKTYKANITDLEGEIHSKITIISNFSISLSTLDRSFNTKSIRKLWI